MTLDELIEQLLNSRAYDERAAEQVLSHYMRFYQRLITEIVELSRDVASQDMEQELRICMYQAWLCYDRSSNITLRRWLSYKTRFRLLDIRRRVLKRAVLENHETLSSTDSDCSTDD